MSEYLLEMTDISKAFPGVQALDKACLRLRPGTVHALMGENGAGKSTLMKCLFGVYTRDSGNILYNGEPLVVHNTHDALTKGIAMVQ
ncbi:MAG: sugar ABC transporter ATP-binding protein, partial [Eubacteriaceae bacterium]|nr:sugar ABC transporter ATP-binding protein [Eubacteriaceae bacterium]